MNESALWWQILIRLKQSGMQWYLFFLAGHRTQKKNNIIERKSDQSEMRRGGSLFPSLGLGIKDSDYYSYVSILSTVSKS